MRLPFLLGLPRLAASFLLISVPAALPVGEPSTRPGPAVATAPGGEDDCLHSLGYGGTPAATRVVRPKAPGGIQRALVCNADSARANSSFPLKTTVDFVPITGDDSMGFYVIYSARLDASGTAISNNVGIFLFELANGEVLVFGSGYGNIPGVNANDAAFDMARVDTVIRACMGRDPATTPLRIVAPHGHGDHINPACNAELRAMGYTIVEIAFHQGDQPLITGMNWTQQDRALFNMLSTGASCQDEILGYDSPLGHVWFHHRPGHTDGSIDCVIDVRGDTTNRFLIRGSQAGTGCSIVPGVREIVNAHGNSVLTATLPTLTGLAPNTGTSLGGTSVTVTGSGFATAGAGQPQVLFDGVPATGVVVVSGTQLTCTTPPGTAGAAATVQVVNNNGRVQFAGGFAYLAAPSLVTVTPSAGDWRGGNTVALAGSGFSGAGTNEIFFGAARATNVTVQNSGLVACRVPAGTPGTTVSVSLRNNNGQAFLASAYTYQADLVIIDVAPASGTSLGGTPVTLTGFAFTGDGNPPSVSFDGVAAANVTLVSNASVTCLAPPGIPGSSVQVSLANSVGVTHFNSFRYHARPTLGGLSPSIGDATGGTTVTLTGTGFSSDGPGTNTVTFGGVPATNVTIQSDSSLTCRTPPGVSGQVVDLAISNANGGASLVGAWRYGQILVLDSVLPVSGTHFGGVPVTIRGGGFLNGPAGPNTVLFGGVAASSVSVIDDGTLTCFAPSGTPGTSVAVRVTNTNGTLSLPAAFRYHAQPVVTGISPVSGHAGEFIPVTLTGSGFLNDEAGPGFVVFGGIAASDVAVVDDSTLLCIAPPGAAGTTTDVIFANQNGMAQLSAGFRYHAAPAIASLVPPSGPGNGGQRVTINGSGFLDDQAGANAVFFGSSPAANLTVLSDGALRVDAPTGTPGTSVDVRVGNARGSTTLAQGYRYHARPALTGLTPLRGTFQGGTEITITGTGFAIDGPGANQVTFGGVAATQVLVVADGTLTCQTPPGALDSTVDVVLSNANGNATLSQAFSYSVPAPSLAFLTPATGPALGGSTIQLSGTGFVANAAGVNSVQFGTVPALAVTALDDQTLECLVPEGVPGTQVPVVVSNINGSATLASGYRYHALPAVAAITPAGASALGLTSVTLSGAGFQLDAAGINRVRFGARLAADVVVLNDTTLRCTAPAADPGPVQVLVENDNGTSTPFAFSYHPYPTLLTLSPPFGPAFGDQILVLTGTGFLDNGALRNEVRIGGKLSPQVTVVSDTRIECATPRGTPGFADVRVTNDNGSALLPNAYHYGRLPALVAGITPDHGSPLGNTTVTVTGSGFIDNGAGRPIVDFGGLAATNLVVLDDTTIVCTTPPGLSGATAVMTLQNNNGVSESTPSFRYHRVPTLTSISPDGGKAFGGERVTLRGSGFLTDAAGPNRVSFASVLARDVVVVDDTTITCTAPGGSPGAEVDVTVLNDNGQAALADAFRLVGGAPSLASVTPNRGLFNGGTLVELQGRGFTEPGAGRLSVWFGATQGANLTVLDDRNATCNAPAGPVNTIVSVTVRNRNGAGTKLDAYSFESIPPQFTALTPDRGSALGGTRLQLTGQDFLAAGAGIPTITFEGIPATNVTVLTDTSLTCDSPAGVADSTVDVQLTNGNGRATLLDAFHYFPLPRVIGIGPVHGPPGGGTAVTVTGSGFTANGAGAVVVTLDGVPATNVQVVDDTTLTCRTPAGAGGTLAALRVSNANGSATLGKAFRYHANPAITAILPARGPAVGGTTVTLLGSGFVDDQAGASTVTFDGVPAVGVTILDDETLACLTPAGISGRDVDVVVANANGSATRAAAFHFHPVVTLTMVTPARGPEAGGAAVTLKGAGFQADNAGPAAVTFGGLAAADVVVVDDTTITCSAPAGTAGLTVAIRVVNAHGSSSLPGAFFYHGVPRLDLLAPDHGSSIGGSSITLTGRGLVNHQAGTNSVTFGGVPATQVVVVDDSTLTCRAPAGTPQGLVDVAISNANGTTSLSSAFRYHALPTLGGLTPQRGVSAGGTTVSLFGTGFSNDQAGVCSVFFDGVPATGISVLDDDTLACTAPAGTPLANVDVRLSNANGSATLTSAFHYHPTVTVTGLDRARGPESGGTAVTVSGAGFLDDGAGQALVTFGGSAALDVVVVDDATLTCTSPAGTAGRTIDVVVTNAHGTASLPAAFLYHGVPQLTTLTPGHGTSLGGSSLTLTGRAFVADQAGTNIVTLGGLQATSVVAVDDTTLTCTAPTGTPGLAVDVQVTNANGTTTLLGAFRYHLRPSLTDLTPLRGPSAGDTLVTVHGTGFTNDQAGACAVTFDGVAATAVTILDDSTLTCITPAGTALDDVDVQLSNANGSAALASAFHYHPTVSVTALDRTRGPELGGTAVTVTGTGFLDDGAGLPLVTFGGLTALDVIVVDDTRLTCTTPTGVAGQTVDIMVANAHGVATLQAAFLYHGVPQLTALAPDHGTGLGGTSVTLSGRGFVADLAGTNRVTFGGIAATNVLARSDDSVTCTVPAGTAGSTVDVRLTNDNGTSQLLGAFRYHARPALTSVTPARGPAAGGTTVTIVGSGFAADAPGTNGVTFGGVSATGVSVVNDTTITCVVPAGTPASTVALVVSNANGSITLASAFRYNPLPILTSVAPTEGSPLGGTSVTLRGTGFFDFTPGATTVTFAGVAATNLTILDDATLTCLSPEGPSATAVDVRLSNLNGNATLAQAFTYRPAPTVTSVTPVSGPAAGGGVVTLQGTGFTAASAAGTFVTFGGVASFNVTILDDSTLTCEVPAGTPGATIDISVVNDNGIATRSSGYRYHALPTLLAIDPPSGLSVVPVAVTLTGSGFTADGAGPSTVLFGAQAGLNVVVVDDATITCSAPAAPAGTSVTVSVANANGTATRAGFTYAAPAPTLAGLAPVQGTSNGGTVVTLTGTNFLAPNAGTNRVTFGGVACPSVNVVDDATIQCATPTGTVDQIVDVVLTNDNGSATLATAFTYRAPAPTLVAVAPNHGSALTPTSVTLTGTGFQAFAAGANTVTFDGLGALNVVTVDDTTIQCNVPAGAAGSLATAALTNANGNALLPGAFRYHAQPALATVTPASGTSLGGSLVTVRGSGFLADAAGANTVTFGGVPASSITIVDDATLTCRVPAGGSGANVDLRVSNANGTTILAGGYRYHPRPTLTGVLSPSGVATGGTRVTITGTGFRTDGAVVNIVSFGGLVASAVSVLDDSTIQCNTPAGSAGLSVQVTVANVNGTAILPSGFRYHARPAVTVVAPANGPEAGGTTVTLTGAGFQKDSPGATAVTFGGAPATSVTVLSDTQATCVTPPGVAGALVDVTVSNTNGSGTLTSAYLYDAGTAPIVASVTPAKGSTRGNTQVRLVGAGFDPTQPATVRFGTSSATNVTVVDENTIVCQTPVSSESAWVDVSVSQPEGSSSLQHGFRFVHPPVLSSIDPPVGVPAGGSLVTLSGSGFLEGDASEPEVLFDGSPAPFVMVFADDLLVCEVPPGELLSAADVEVRNDIGRARLNTGFRWQLELSTDLNRDGRGDLVLGASGHEASTPDVGAVHVFFGSTLPTLDRNSDQADVVAVPTQANAGFGAPVATGDLDGDGIADLLVGAPLDDEAGPDAGAVFLFRGPLTGSPLRLTTAEASAVLRGTVAGQNFGSSLCLHDIDRDGLLDLLVGSPGNRTDATGRLSLFLGTPEGPSTVPSVTFRSPSTEDGFAAHVAAGDLDGDGWAEIVVGAPRAASTVQFFTLGSAPSMEPVGAVHVFQGGPSLAHDQAPEISSTYTGTHPGGGFGSALAVRDLDGDHIDDLVVGAPSGTDGGTVSLFLGGPERDGALATSADATLRATDATDRFGLSMAVGDVDGDGLADLLVGAPGTAPTGRAYLFLGGRSFDRSASLADLTLDPEPVLDAAFGATVALVDVDGNGLEDMVVTAPSIDTPATDTGRVYVFCGAPMLQSRQASNDDGTVTGSRPGNSLGIATPSDH